MTPEEFNKKYPDLECDYSGYISKGKEVRYSSFLAVFMALEKSTALISSRLKSHRIKNVDQFVKDVAALSPYFRVYGRNAAKDYPLSSSLNPLPKEVKKKLVKTLPVDNAKYDHRRETVLLNLIIEVTTLYWITEIAEQKTSSPIYGDSKALHISWTDKKNDKKGNYSFPFGAEVSQRFKDLALEQLNAAIEIHDIIYK